MNGSPINLVQPEILRFKIYEPVLVAGEDSFAPLDIRVRAKGGGHTSQVYAIRQAIAKALVAYYAKYIDAYSAMELKKKLVAYDRTLLIADPRRMEPKKFGGAGARARRQKRFVHRLREVREHSTDKNLQLPVKPLFWYISFLSCYSFVFEQRHDSMCATMTMNCKHCHSGVYMFGKQSIVRVNKARTSYEPAQCPPYVS